ncbi:MAG: hypothetical protein IJA32_08355 [Lachnospiraceae bacterium]|nr:hypothetical protein [Lachnospiraceae bacterium]
MRKKKLVSVLLLCMLALTGCGGKNNKVGERDSVLDNIDEKDKTGNQEDTTEEDKQTDDEEDQKMEDMAAPQVEIQGEFVEDRYYENGTLSLCNLTYSTLGLNDDEYPELRNAFDEWSINRQNELTALLDEYALMAAENTALLEEYLEYDYRCMFSVYQSLEVERADSQVVSLLEYTSNYTASENDIHRYTGVNFDAATGNILSLSDILEDEEGFYAAATDYIIEELKQTQFEEDLMSGYEEKVADMWWNGNVSWYLDAAGVTIVLNPWDSDEIIFRDANYMGVRCTLPYAEFSDYLSDKYAGTQYKGVARLTPGEDYLLETSNGTINVNVELQENYDMGFNSVIINAGDSAVKVGEFSYVWNTYIIKRNDDRVFLVITNDYMSDDYVTSLYEITDGNIKFLDEMSGASVEGGTINNESISLNIYLNVLGSYISKTEYEIDENGKFRMMDEMYHIGQSEPAYNTATLTTIQELPVVIDGMNTVLPAGSRICITGTDNVSIITFYDVDTQQSGEIHYERGEGEDSWMIYINGCSEYDYFENLPYAG